MPEKVPQYLSTPLQIAWFESDEVAIMMILFSNAMIFTGWWSWGALFVLSYLYIRLKKRYPRGFLKHMTFFMGFKDLKHYPGPFENNFME